MVGLRMGRPGEGRDIHYTPGSNRAAAVPVLTDGRASGWHFRAQASHRLARPSPTGTLFFDEFVSKQAGSIGPE
jgi:hypothetical protein